MKTSTPREKLVYIFPGFGGSMNSQIGRRICGLFKKAGFVPKPIHVKWRIRRHVFALPALADAFVASLENAAVQGKQRDAEIYLFGFSFGAMIALMAAQTLKPKLTILCSLSPYFKEDIENLPALWKKDYLKSKKDGDAEISFDAIARRIRSEVLLIAGDKEGREMAARVADAHRRLKKSSVITIKGAEHNISQKEYYAALKKVISCNSL